MTQNSPVRRVKPMIWMDFRPSVSTVNTVSQYPGIEPAHARINNPRAPLRRLW